MPRTRSPWLRASIVAEAMTPLIPGAGPPPTRIASVSSSPFMRALYRGRDGRSHPPAQLDVDRVQELRRRQPRLIRADQQREILRHLAGLDDVDAHLLERLGEARHVRRPVHLPAVRETARPGEDRGDRVRRGLAALLVLAVVPRHRAVRGLGL